MLGNAVIRTAVTNPRSAREATSLLDLMRASGCVEQSADFGNMGSMGGGGQDANFQAMESIAKAGFGVYGEKLYGKGQSFVHKYLPGKATLYPYLNVNNRCA
jgi:hypothetical protein